MLTRKHCVWRFVVLLLCLTLWNLAGELQSLYVWPFWFLNYLLGGRNCNREGMQSNWSVCTWLSRPTDAFLQRFGIKPSYSCKHWERWGSGADGGYAICLDDEVNGPKPKQDGCIAYNFGSNLEWDFDLALLEKGCEVYTFDPTVSVRPASEGSDQVAAACSGNKRCGQLPDGRIHFSQIGLSGADVYVDGVGETRTLRTIMEQNGHDHVDLLKVDIENSEWPFLHTLSQEVMSRVGQFVLEIHMHPNQLSSMMQSLSSPVHPTLFTRQDAYDVYVTELDKLISMHGFKVAFNQPNYVSSIELVGPWPVLSCYELTYVRLKQKEISRLK